MEIDFSQAQPWDTDDLTALLNEVTRYLHGKGIQQWDYPWDPAVIAADIAAQQVFVLRHADVLIGSYSARVRTEAPWLVDADRPATPFFYLYRIALHPDVQGDGIGGKLLTHARAQAKMRNMTAYLNCWAGNRKLRHFYCENGFEWIGDFPENDYQISAFCFPAEKTT